MSRAMGLAPTASGPTFQDRELGLEPGAKDHQSKTIALHTSRKNRPKKGVVSPSGVTAISLFSGAGGLDIGFEAAGFEIRASIEIDPDARATVAANGRGTALLSEGDIFNLSIPELLGHAKVKSGELDALIAGPPCQPFSMASLWAPKGARGLLDPRSRTIDALLDAVDILLPRIVVIENVPGFIQRGSTGPLALIEARLTEINQRRRTRYHANAFILNSLDFGVAQRRTRAFVVALREGIEIGAPTPTHGPRSLFGLAHRTAWDAIGDLDVGELSAELTPTGRWAGLLCSIPEGQNYLFHTDRGLGLPIFGWRTRFWTFLLKLAKAKPGWTLSANPGPATGPFHWRNRLLSLREIARLAEMLALLVLWFRIPRRYKPSNLTSARRQLSAGPALCFSQASESSSLGGHAERA
jgi:DNA (cytosine-5)-methyltransferase 1